MEKNNISDEEYIEILKQMDEEEEQHNLQCIKLGQKWRMWLGNKINIHEAYSELYRVSNHLLNYVTGDIGDKCIIVFTDSDKQKIINSEKGFELLSKVNKIDLNTDEIITINKENHRKNVDKIKQIFHQLIPTKTGFKLSEQNHFTYENAYEELYKIILIMIRSLMHDVINYNIIWSRYEHHHKTNKYLSRKLARKLIKKCDKLISRDILIPETYIHQDQHLDFFEKIFKKIATCPKDCFRFWVTNKKRDIDFKEWLRE